jgi:hypothetical protein
MIADAQAKAHLEDRFDLRAVAARWGESHREAADRFLDLYQNAVGRFADEHVKRARAVDHPAVFAIAETQAGLGREVADAYVRSVRKLLDS